VLLPFAEDAAAWFVETARAAVASGERLDADAVQLLMTLAPGDSAIPIAIERLALETGTTKQEPRTENREPGTGKQEPGTLAGHAREAIARLREAVVARDEAAAREIVTALELEVLGRYRPSHGLDGFENDIAVALAMLAAYDIGADESHLMMAEELMLGMIRREWAGRAEYDIAANCEAAVALAALAARTGKPEYRDRALEVMRGYAATYRELGMRAAPYVSALQVIS
jgi:uncharacterized protein YyaL (SSP411 family)